ncbi:MAG TPA: ABC transporter permease subunit [Vicinamibacteria bacterium]|nr:ABC transporter permease subunit [Vicinamibacteria bacterium]
MPIYDQGYRRYVARSPLQRARFWPITREPLRMLLLKRLFLALLLSSLAPLVVSALWIYIVTRYPESGRLLPIDGQLFGEMLKYQMLFGILLSVFGASGSIANDLRSGAMLVYLSRPLTKRDYLLGKLGVPLLLNLAVMLVPGLLLYLAGLGLAPEQYLRWHLAWIAPSIVAYSVAAGLAISLLTLAVSSLSRSARVAGIGLVAALVGLEMTRLILQYGFDRKEAVVVSLWADLKALGVALFAVPDPQIEISWVWPLLVLALVSVGCLLVLRARVRAVEIVT